MFAIIEDLTIMGTVILYDSEVSSEYLLSGIGTKCVRKKMCAGLVQQSNYKVFGTVYLKSCETASSVTI